MPTILPGGPISDPGTPASGPAPPDRPLQGRRAWVITDGKAGMEVQCVGVAEALGADYSCIRVSPDRLCYALAPWGPMAPKYRFAAADSPFAPPFPDIAIATGRQSIPYIRAIGRKAGRATFTVVIQNPRTGPRTADLIAVPEHDRLKGENVLTTLTAPHNFGPQRLTALRRTPPDDIAALGHPRLTVILGGPNAIYRYTPDDIARLAGAIGAISSLGAHFMITTSRRTPPALLDAVRGAIGAAPAIVWDGDGPNPYVHFLAQADALVATADSVNMTGEACATGRPVYVFEPSGGSPKFTRFHEALRRYGATRPLPETLSALDHWRYAPLDSAADIAREVERRWLARQG